MKWGIEVEIEFLPDNRSQSLDQAQHEALDVIPREVPNDIARKTRVVVDGSLRNGVELIFGVFEHGDDVYESIRDVLEFIDESFTVCNSPFCGLHVNIGTENMSQRAQLGFTCLWHIYEARFVSAWRKMNAFSPRLSESLDFLQIPVSTSISDFAETETGVDGLMLAYLNRGSRYKNIAYRGDRFEIRQLGTEVPLVRNVHTLRDILEVMHGLRELSMEHNIQDILSGNTAVTEKISNIFMGWGPPAPNTHERMMMYMLRSLRKHVSREVELMEATK